ncbi:hypothetical protein GGI12_004844 [Dipsacomyces acuminosporus]|nr:hypothetical protein GGI12_004844 [Dipsacomyces acuminosporus]
MVHAVLAVYISLLHLVIGAPLGHLGALQDIRDDLTFIQRGSYFLEFHSEPSNPNCDAEHAKFEKLTKASGFVFHTRNKFKRLFNGVSIDLPNACHLELLSSLPMVKRAWPMQVRSRSAAIPSSNAAPNLMYAHQHTGVDKAQSKLGLDGAGIKVGVIDTGVDYMHPDLGACWKTAGCPFQYGSDFVGDSYDSSSTPHPRPGPDPRDTCDGHGTHVTGIIAANGPKVRGVAPGVTLGVYRIFGCPGNGTGQAADDIILKAMEAAHADGMNVINMSFGGGSGWSEDPLAVAASRLVRDGIVVVASAGNDGANGLYTSGSPGLGAGVINVASFENWMVTSVSIDIVGARSNFSIVHSSPGNSKYRFTFEAPTEIKAPVDTAGSREGCAPYDTKFSNQILVIKRGNCTFVDKAQHAQAAGAVGVLIVNNEDELMSPTSASPNVTIPVVVIKSADGEAIVSELGYGKVTITATNQTMSVPNKQGGQISHFSSWGPDPELYLSPAVGAPGGNIFSTFPLALGGYTSLSGTSMASPYVAGMAALILQSRSKKVSAGDVKRLILESAQPVVNGNTTKILSPLRQGSGLANIYSSISALATIDPSQISINNTVAESAADKSVAAAGLDRTGSHAATQKQGRAAARGTAVSVHTLTLFNHSPKSHLTYTVYHLPADSVSSFMANGSFAPVPRVWPEDNSTRVAQDTLPHVTIEDQPLPARVAPGTSQHIRVRIAPPKGLKTDDRWFYGGYLRFNLLWADGKGTSQTIHVPYSGFLGDYSKLDVLSVPEEGLPFVSRKGSADSLAENSHIAINSTHRLAVHYRLEHPTRVLKLQLVNEKNATQGYLPYGYMEYVGRSYQSSRGRYSNSTINGTLFHDTDLTRPFATKPGSYRVRIDALRPLRDPNDPEGYQVWYSPQFIIDSVDLSANKTASKEDAEDSDEDKN